MNTTKHKLVLSHIVCIVSVNGHISNIAAVPIHTLVYKHTLISTLKNHEKTEENKMRMCVDIARELRLCCPRPSASPRCLGCLGWSVQMRVFAINWSLHG